MFVTIINDCRDDNAMSRQRVRAISLMGAPVSSVGVGSDLEAAGNLVDVLDASLGRFGVVLVNVARREGEAKKKWPNGTPFGYFTYKDVIVVSSIDGYALSLVKKLGMLSSLKVFDIPTVMDFAIERGLIKEEFREYMITTQFRSYEFVPRVASWLVEQIDVPSEVYDLNDIADVPHAVWMKDCFGNCKTTILPDEVEYMPGKTLKVAGTDVTTYERLKDVEDKQPGIVVGSSGIEHQRFLEVVVQGGSAAETLGIDVGSKI